MQRSVKGLVGGVVGAGLLWLVVAALRARSVRTGVGASLSAIWQRTTDIPWRSMLLTASVIVVFAGWVAALWPVYHVFGTDQTGNDVLFQAMKSIRTAVVIGSLATLATLPFAIVFGILAGYYKGRVDDAIQYLYTMLSSIPSVLLIAAFVLMIQVFVDKNPQMFETALQRADIRLFLLAAILGLTGWAGLARLLRAETLKLSELDYVQAARAFGVSNTGIMRRHILPNVTHVVLIVAVLDFSGLVLYEAVLSYVGVGVDPTTNSFGTMINSARNEMSRDPVVWWTLAAAFSFMVALVLSMQFFASAVNEAFDPRARAFRVRRAKPAPRTADRAVPARPSRPATSAMLAIENLTTEIDSDSGVVRAVDALIAHDRARRDVRARGRIGMRQVDDGLVDPAALAGCRAGDRRNRSMSTAMTSCSSPRCGCATFAATVSASSSRSRRRASTR